MGRILVVLFLMSVPAFADDAKPIPPDIRDPATAGADEVLMFSPDDFERLAFDAKQARERAIAEEAEKPAPPITVTQK